MGDYNSGSELPRVSKCAASGALPKVRRIGDKDRMGSALHEHARDRVILGLAGAFDRLQIVAEAHDLDERESSIFKARAAHFTWTPPRGAMPEIALALLENGEAVVVQGGRGQYPELPLGAIAPATTDVFWAEPRPLFIDKASGRLRCPEESVLWVADIKTGRELYVDPVEKNWQALTEMLLAARWTGAKRAIPALIFWQKGDGLWDVASHTYDEAALLEVERGVRKIHARATEQRHRLAAGIPLEYVTGGHCTYCDSAIYCGAKTAEIKRVLDDPHPLDVARLTDEQLRKLAQMEPQIASLAKTVRAALVSASSSVGPIRMTDGRFWGAYDQPKDELDPEIAMRVLEGEIGAEQSRRAFAFETSKSAIEQAIKSAHKAKGIERQGAAAMRRVMAQLREAGGITRVFSTSYGPHVSTEETPSVLPAKTAAGALEIDGDS